MSFNDKNGKSYLHGFGGANNYSGFYEANADGSFSVGTIGSTERSSNDGEILYYSLLPQVRKYAIDGKKLIFSDKDGKELLVFEKSAEDKKTTAILIDTEGGRHNLPAADAEFIAKLIEQRPDKESPGRAKLAPIFSVILGENDLALQEDELILVLDHVTKQWKSPGILTRIMKATGVKRLELAE